MFRRAIGKRPRPSWLRSISRSLHHRTSLPLALTRADRFAVCHAPQFPRMYFSISTQGENLEGKIDKLSDQDYNSISNDYLDDISDALEELNEEFEQVDAELSHGVLTLTLPPNGTYVINKQPPNHQIWLSSPISGPKRYDLIGGRWITLRDGTSLTQLLEEEISGALKTDFKFGNER